MRASLRLPFRFLAGCLAFAGLLGLAGGAAAQWYPDDSMYTCNYRFISGPNQGASGVEQRWLVTAGSDTRKTGFTRMRWSQTASDEVAITLTKQPGQGPNQWRAEVPGITCDLFNVLDANHYEFRRCSNGVELDCERHSYYHGGLYEVVPWIKEAAIHDAHEGSGNGPAGFLYFVAAGQARRGSFGSLGCPGGACGVTEVPEAWASNFQGPVELSESARPERQWSVDPLQGGQRGRYFCPAECATLCGNHQLGGCSQCQEDTSLPCVNVVRGAEMVDGRIAQVARVSYPYVWGVQRRVSPGGFLPVKVQVREDDGGDDDAVGAFELRRSSCSAQVWSQGQVRGWTPVARVAGEPYGGNEDIAFVKYRLWCNFSVFDPGWVL